MNILIVGSGGREHALAWKLAQSPGVERVFCAPGNGGTEQEAENVALNASDLPGLLAFAKENRVELTVVGPDDPLAAGIVDLFADAGLPIFGPSQSAARIESSKIFAKQLMRRKGIPTAQGSTFEGVAEARNFCRSARYPLVIKANGLALGKGVVIARDHDEALDAIDQMMVAAQFGEAGRQVVIEEFLSGKECSVHALVSGDQFQMLATARDHKRAYDGDAGPNTGGMGAISPADTWSEAVQTHFGRQIMTPLLDGLRDAGISFRGLLFPGLMITERGPQVLEFNCRFGDPETQAILPRLKSDLLPLLNATVTGSLNQGPIEWDDRFAVTVVLASRGYPGPYETGKPISGLERVANLPDVHVFHAGTRATKDRIVTSGGRVLAVTGLGHTIEAAREHAYGAASQIHFDGCHYRRDIALSAVEDMVGGERNHVPA